MEATAEELTDTQQAQVDIVLRQTTYDKATAIQKLQENQFNSLLVIREFMGLKKTEPEQKVNSLNQEIYRQLRKKLNG